MIPLFVLLIIIPPKEAERVSEKLRQAEDIPVKKGFIMMYNVSESRVDEYLLEEYVAGVVAAEMPASFHEEALKAQAVAARTFALSRKEGLYGSFEEHFGANVCTDPGHCQAWVSKEKFIERSGNTDGWSKIEKAVKKTEGLVMTYAGKLINPLYHSNSGGVTEDVEEVWSVSGEVPYLKSVYSPDESKYSEFEKKTIFQLNDIRKKVKDKYPDTEFSGNPEKDIEITSYSSSGRVDEIRTGSVKMSGTEFRELLSLRSTNLEIAFSDRNTVEIISRGYGHGVGMSQCGADALGKKGKSFKSILEYYYTGVNVEEAEK
jgi:stage II sporulation protein D